MTKNKQSYQSQVIDIKASSLLRPFYIVYILLTFTSILKTVKFYWIGDKMDLHDEERDNSKKDNMLNKLLIFQVVPQMPPDRSPFFRSLVEDMLDHVTYVDCLCQIHRGIQKRLWFLENKCLSLRHQCLGT